MNARVSQRCASLAALLWTCGLGACNQVLGIDAPHVLDDAGVIGDGDPLPDGGSTETPGHSSNPGKVNHYDELPPASFPWAGWPMPNPAADGVGEQQAYTVNIGGFVVDDVTALEWQRRVDANVRSWQDAKAYCKALTLDGGRFRLPSRIELVSLLDLTTAAPSINGDAFPDTPGDAFWTDSPFAGAEKSAWIVQFGFSTTVTSSDNIGGEHYVRCVRQKAVEQP